MYVKSEIFEDVVGALGAGGFLSFCVFEEKLDAGLEFGIEPSQLAMHHLDYLVVVLQSQENVFEACQ
jgi:predicted TPR repeat methyltransferase